MIETLEVLEKENNNINGIKSNFRNLNSFLNKYYRFGTVNLIAGYDGVGKTTLLMQLQNDFLFTDSPLKGKFDIIHINYNITKVNFEIKLIGNKISKSYTDIVSGNEKKFNNLEKVEFVDTLKNYPQNYTFINETYDIDNLIKTLITMANNSTNKIVLLFDNILTIPYDTNIRDEFTLVLNIMKKFQVLKKLDFLVIFTMPLNDNIARNERLYTVTLQKPVKSDIMFSEKISWGCDTICILHRPEILGIDKYGINKVNSKDYVELRAIKNNYGEIGVILMKNDLINGRFLEVNQNLENKNSFSI